MKVIRVLVYEGDSVWMKKTLERSLVNGEFCVGNGKITVTNILVDSKIIVDKWDTEKGT
jgi:hypothetical protein